jgi:outer membrane protein TolC
MKNMELRAITRLVMMATLFVCIAGGVQAKELTLYEVVNKAIEYYPLLQQRKAEYNASRAHVSTVRSNRFPSLKLHDQVNVGTANSLTGTYFPLGTVVPVAGAIRNDNVSTLASGNIGLAYMEWEAINFGYYGASNKEAIAGEALRSSVFENDKYQVTETVISLYLDLLKQYEYLKIEQNNVQRAKTIFDAINATVVSGLKPGVDSTTARAEYSRARVGYLQAMSNYADARIALANYTGLDTTRIEPDTNLFDKMHAIGESFTSDSISDEHPMLDVYKKQYDLQLADNKVVAHKYLPKVYLLGAASVRGSSITGNSDYSPNLADGLSYSRYNYALGAAFTYNIFDLKHRHDQLVEGKYEAEAKKQALNARRMELTSLLKQTKEAYDNTVLQLQELPVQVNAARQAYEQQMALYRGGLNTLVDVTNALYAVNKAESSYVIGKDAFLRLMSIRAGINNQLDTFIANFK